MDNTKDEIGQNWCFNPDRDNKYHNSDNIIDSDDNNIQLTFTGE